MENFAIKIEEQQLEAILQPGAAAQFLSTLFQPATVNYQLLVYELQREFRQWGSPDIKKFSFDRVVFDPVMQKGSFRILLNVSFTFSCEDSVTEKKDQTSEWTFAIDSANKVLRFYSSPFAESRSTADEF
ncbi:hypothetical protein [Mucilaginibacter auburnensis]|nr:hypothetical protein [Mucilaginibacter auburnensis]